MLSPSLRATLKRNRLVYTLNARWKAWRLRRDLSALGEKYEALARRRGVSYQSAAVAARVSERLSRLPPVGCPPRVLWVGANRNQDESGFLPALRRVAQVWSFENSDGCQSLMASRPGQPMALYDADIVAENSRTLLEQVGQLKAGPGLDLVFGQMWANLISEEAMGCVRGAGIRTANVSMDDRLPEHWGAYGGVRLGAIGLARAVDLTLTSSPETCLWYEVEGASAVFWPMASDPAVFYPRAEDEKTIDVCFVGSNYGVRGAIVAALRRARIRVDAYGPGWPNGPVGPSRAADLFSRSKIILGIGTLGYNHDLFTLKLRDFDATMAGSLYLTHRNPDLLAFFEEGVEIECYATPNECVQKARFYLDHPAERQRIASAAALRARRSHSWEHRFAALFEWLSMTGPAA